MNKINTAKTILIISSYAPSLIKFRGDMIQEFIGLGHSVHCISAKGYHEETFNILRQMGVGVSLFPLQRTGRNILFDVITIVSLFKIIAKVRPDKVLSYTVKPMLYGSFVTNFYISIEHYAMITGMPNLILRLSSRWLGRKLLQVLFQRNQHILFQNRDDEMAFKQWGYLINGQSVRTCGSGINIIQYSYSKPLIKNDVSFLLIARLLYDKGVIEFLQAAQIIIKEFNQARFSIIGWFDTANPNGIEPEIFKSYLLHKRIVFLGRCDDVRPPLRDHSVYVLPSYHEGMPRTVLEAMSIGRPIITTNVPGCRDTVNEGKNGYLVPPRNIDELAKAMKKFILEPEKISSMGRESRLIAEQYYNVETVNQQIISTMGL